MITPEFLEELDYSKLVMIYSKLNIKLTELILYSMYFKNRKIRFIHKKTITNIT